MRTSVSGSLAPPERAQWTTSPLLLAERREDVALARTALAQLTAAFDASRDGGHLPLAVHYEAQLAKAQALIERLDER